MGKQVNTELERAEARYLKCKALRDVRKRQYQAAERDFTAATDKLYAAIFKSDTQGLLDQTEGNDPK
jgi:hypothetical protein